MVLQWMTAGRGVVHAEMPVSEGPVTGLQLWVNLPRRDKMVEPAYQELRGREIPKPNQGGVTVSVISGEALGAKVCLCVSLCVYTCLRLCFHVWVCVYDITSICCETNRCIFSFEMCYIQYTYSIPQSK